MEMLSLNIFWNESTLKVADQLQNKYEVIENKRIKNYIQN